MTMKCLNYMVFLANPESSNPDPSSNIPESPIRARLLAVFGSAATSTGAATAAGAGGA